MKNAYVLEDVESVIAKFSDLAYDAVDRIFEVKQTVEYEKFGKSFVRRQVSKEELYDAYAKALIDFTLDNFSENNAILFLTLESILAKADSTIQEKVRSVIYGPYNDSGRVN